MKTYEMKMSRSRWMSLVIAILLVVVLVNLCAPYFTYGVEESKMLPSDDAHQNRLVGTWYLNGADASQDNYREIEILDGVKSMKVRTTNIIRKNQMTADEALEKAIANYEKIAAAITEAEKYKEQAKAYYDVVKAAHTVATEAKAKADEALNADGAIDVNNAAEQQAIYSQEIEKLKAELAAASENLANTKAAYETANNNLTAVETALKGEDVSKIAELKALLDSSTTELANADAEYKALTAKLNDITAQIEAAVKANDEFNKNAYSESVVMYVAIAQLDTNAINRNLTNVEKYYNAANDKYEELKTGLKTAEVAVLEAIDAVKTAYSADAAYAIVEEDATVFNAERDAAIAERIISKLPSLADAEEAKATADAEKKAADDAAKISKGNMDAAKKAMDEAEKLYKALSEPSAVLPAAIADPAPARSASSAAANTIFPDGAKTDKEVEIEQFAAQQKTIADEQLAEKVNIESAKNLLTRLTDAYAQAEAALKIKNDSENPEIVAAAEEAYKEAEKEYKKLKEKYDKDKTKQDEAKKNADAMKAELERVTKVHEDAIAAVSEEEKDNYVFDKLNADKEKAANAAATANRIIKEAGKLAEMYEKSNGALQTAKKNYDNTVKEFDKFYKNVEGIVDSDLLVVPEVKFVATAEEAAALEAANTEVEVATEGEAVEAPETEAAKIVVLTPVELLEIEEIERPAEQLATSDMIETEGKVKYTFKKGVGTLELTFANDKKVVTDFASSFSYDGIKTISIMSYIGFPYDATQFADEMANKIPNFYINDVVLIPIVIGILALIGIVMCFLKRDKMSSAYVPVALGIVGIIGYMTSDFLKLGDMYIHHLGCYAVIFVISVLQILFHVNDKKKA